MGVAGPTSSGKTCSSLRLARGLVGDAGKVALIDTEHGRASQYANDFAFDSVDLDPPFNPERYLEAIVAADTAGYHAVIVDSMTHEHEGEGGVLDMHDKELDRRAGDDYAKRDRLNFGCWIKPKAERQRLIGGLIRVRAHLILCFRAKEKIKLVRIGDPGKEKLTPVPQGWQPICGHEIPFELTILAILPAGANGIPDWTAEAAKILGYNDRLKACFAAGEPLSENTGRAIAKWTGTNQEQPAASTTAPAPPTDGGLDALDAGVLPGGKADPHRVPLPTNPSTEDWRVWRDVLAERLRLAPTTADLAALKERNAPEILRLNDQAPLSKERLDGVAKDRFEELTAGDEPEPDARI